jgi:Co/Zn/Cd efflux system component
MWSGCLEAADKVDAAMESSREGMRALWISLGVLGVTALAQAVVVVWSGSVALLDTLHNAADALTAVPLGIAFTVGRRAPTRRYTYGYGRAEDLAGVVIVLFIVSSSSLHPPRSWPATKRYAGWPTHSRSVICGRLRPPVCWASS